MKVRLRRERDFVEGLQLAAFDAPDFRHAWHVLLPALPRTMFGED